MANLPQKLTLPQLENQWASIINPVLANLLVQGQLLPNQALIDGSNAINHKLGRTPQGWFLVSPQGPTSVYQASYQIHPMTTLTLISNSAVITGIWVF